MPEASSGRSTPVCWPRREGGGVLGDPVDAEPVGKRGRRRVSQEYGMALLMVTLPWWASQAKKCP